MLIGGDLNPVSVSVTASSSETTASVVRKARTEVHEDHVISEQSPVIFCMIFTTPDEWMRKALAVRLTWAKRCDFKGFFYSKQDAVSLDGAYALDVPEGREHLTAKTMEALRVSYNTYKSKVDWFLKADDDTYVIMENLKHLRSQYEPQHPHYLGHTSSDMLRHGYNSGGAGYVLSKEAARRVVEDSDKFAASCPLDGGVEDLDIGRCLEALRLIYMVHNYCIKYSDLSVVVCCICVLILGYIRRKQRTTGEGFASTPTTRSNSCLATSMLCLSTNTRRTISHLVNTM